MKKNKLSLTEKENNEIQFVIDRLPPDPSDKQIKDKLEDLRKFDENLNVEKLFNFIRRRVTTKFSEPLSLIKKSVKENAWVEEAKREGKIEFKRWKILKKELKDSGFPEDGIEKLDLHTDQLLDCLYNPLNSTNEDKFDRRGLVTGQVQSGKTTAYLALASKAFDAGYKCLIVLTGLLESLRVQTNSEADRLITGLDTSTPDIQNYVKIGVGNHPEVKEKYNLAKSITLSQYGYDYRGDPLKRIKGLYESLVPDESEKDPFIIITKKNTKILDNIIEHISKDGETNNNAPVLIIDDESDLASIDTSKDRIEAEEDPTAINKKIRQLLNKLDRKAYVAYSATPYANMLIPTVPSENTNDFGPDLYPSDFLWTLPIPENYLGPGKMFGITANEDGEIESKQSFFPGIITIDDTDEIYHGDNWVPIKREEQVIWEPEYLPESLIESIKDFIISTSIKKLRGISGHNTMLIHAIQYKIPHEAIWQLVSNEIYKLEQSWVNNSSQEMWKNKYDEFCEISTASYEYLYSNDTFEKDLFSWSEVKKEVKSLLKILNRQKFKIGGNQSTTIPENIRVINGDNKNYDLDYKKPNQDIIAIGGNVLSRGLVLKGLNVSYYLRSAKTQVADTVMQMGRWFGYRDDYADLIRLYTTEDLENDLAKIAYINASMYHQVSIYQDKQLSPEEFSPYLKTYDFQITSVRKSRDSISFQNNISNTLVQVLRYFTSNAKRESNLSSLNKLINSMNDDSNVAHDSNSKFDKPNQGKGWKWKNVKTEHILKFLDNYQAPSDSVGRVSNPDILSKTILDQQDRNLINNWTVGLMDGGTKEYRGIANYPVKLAGRSEDKKKKPAMSNNGNIFFGAIAGGLSHTRFDLDLNDSPILFDGSTGESLENMIKLTVDQVKTKYGCTKSEYQRLARKPSNGLLLLYLIDNGEIPLLGWAIDFPNLENQKKTTIITRYQNQEGQQLEFEFAEINNEL